MRFAKATANEEPVTAAKLDFVNMSKTASSKGTVNICTSRIHLLVEFFDAQTMLSPAVVFSILRKAQPFPFLLRLLR